MLLERSLQGTGPLLLRGKPPLWLERSLRGKPPPMFLERSLRGKRPKAVKVNGQKPDAAGCYQMVLKCYYVEVFNGCKGLWPKARCCGMLLDVMRKTVEVS